MDITIRFYAAKLTEMIGKPVIVDNKPGALGNIATEYVARAKPDGYTFMITPASSTLAAAAATFKKLPFDPVKDMQPVMLLFKLGFVFAVDGKSPIKSIAELTEALKKKPGNGAYGTGANTGIVAAELYKVRTGFRPIKCSTRASTKISTTSTAARSTTARSIRRRRLSPRAPARSARSPCRQRSRLGSYPDVPTMAESGFPGYDLTPWLGIVVPAGTPKPIVDKLAEWHRKINATPEAKKAMAQFGYDPLDGDADAMAALLKSDIAKWAEFVKLAKIEPQ